MKNKPVISVITIVYNGMPFLKDCIQSVLSQHHQEWELLISDDGSTDGSREHLESLTDSRIKVFKQEKNLGIFDNLNFLFNKATAPISQILCQDDYFINNDSLGSIIDYWTGAPSSVGFVRFNHSAETSRKLVGFQKRSVPLIVPSHESTIWFYLFGNIPGNLSNVSVRTSLVFEQGGFKQHLPYAGDFEFWSRAATSVDMGVEPKEVTFIRRHPGVASNYLNKKGELLDQVRQVISVLYGGLINQYPRSTFLLRLHGTVNYDILQRDTALKRYLKGDKLYLKRLNEVSDNASYVLPSFTRWLLFLGTVGGRFARVGIAKLLMKRTLNRATDARRINYPD